MKTKLLQGLNDQEKQELKQAFLSGRVFRDRMRIVLEAEVASLYTNMKDEKWYESPNWDKIQADRLAQVKAYERIISYLVENNV